MERETNLEKIREMAKLFLDVAIKETRVPFVATHPFTSTWVTMLPPGELVDLHDQGAAQRWRAYVEKNIRGAGIVALFAMLNRPYILTFLSYIEKYLSADDMGTILGHFWQTIEQISLDANVTGEQLVRMFKGASKNTLMDEEELRIYEALPEEITVYRGVTSHNRRRKRAFSWTTDRNVAEWFANRFDTGTGEVWTLTVPKDRILCAFSGGEHEVIVNLYRFKGVEQMKVEEV